MRATQSRGRPIRARVRAIVSCGQRQIGRSKPANRGSRCKWIGSAGLSRSIYRPPMYLCICPLRRHSIWRNKTRRLRANKSPLVMMIGLVTRPVHQRLLQQPPGRLFGCSIGRDAGSSSRASLALAKWISWRQQLHFHHSRHRAIDRLRSPSDVRAGCSRADLASFGGPQNPLGLLREGWRLENGGGAT